LFGIKLGDDIIPNYECYKIVCNSFVSRDILIIHHGHLTPAAAAAAAAA
jgi:hypothetical protein